MDASAPRTQHPAETALPLVAAVAEACGQPILSDKDDGSHSERGQCACMHGALGVPVKLTMADSSWEEAPVGGDLTSPPCTLKKKKLCSVCICYLKFFLFGE